MTKREAMLREMNDAYFRHAARVRGNMDVGPYAKSGVSQTAEGIEALAASPEALEQLDKEQRAILMRYADA